MTAPAGPFVGYEVRYRADGFDRLVRLGALDPAHALAGLSLDAAPAMAARLNGLCPMAHGLAVQRAIAAALGLGESAMLRRRRAQALAVEAAAAAFRFCLTWPRALGVEPAPDPVRRARAAQNDARAASEALHDALAFAARLPLPVDPRLDVLKARVAALSRRLADARAFPPSCTGEANERSGAPLVGGADSPASQRTNRLRSSGSPCNGIGRVETLRGALLCAPSVAEGRVAKATLQSPTDRLFRPGGPAERAYACAQAHEAALVTLALDPCLPVRISQATPDA